MSGARHRVEHFAREAVRGLWGRRAVTALTVAVTAVSLYFLAGFLLGAESMGRVVQGWSERGQVSLFLAPDATAEQIDELRGSIEQDADVGSSIFVSTEEAARRFDEQFAELAALASDLDDIPFPASFEITLALGRRDAATARGVVQRLGRRPGVADAQFDLEWLTGLERAQRLLSVGAVVVGGVLLIGAVFTMTNVVRLALLMRRDEIAILELVGATRAFVLGPFVVEAVIQGIAASAIALAALELTRRVLVAGAGPLGLVGQLAGGGGLSLGSSGVVLGAGVGAALLGTLISYVGVSRS